MSELLPCPFCGGEARIEHDHDSANLKERWSIWHECCEHEGESAGYGHALFPWYETPWYGTEAEAVAAWNTRAERTCHIIGFDDGVDEGIDGEWHQYAEPQYDLSCGHSSQGTEAPNYCPNCGARVRSE